MGELERPKPEFLGTCEDRMWFLRTTSRGLEEVRLASDAQFWAVDDLSEALEVRPELAGGREILQLLLKKLPELKSDRDPHNKSGGL